MPIERSYRTKVEKWKDNKSTIFVIFLFSTFGISRLSQDLIRIKSPDLIGINEAELD